MMIDLKEALRTAKTTLRMYMNMLSFDWQRTFRYAINAKRKRDTMTYTQMLAEEAERGAHADVNFLRFIGGTHLVEIASGVDNFFNMGGVVHARKIFDNSHAIDNAKKQRRIALSDEELQKLKDRNAAINEEVTRMAVETGVKRTGQLYDDWKKVMCNAIKPARIQASIVAKNSYTAKALRIENERLLVLTTPSPSVPALPGIQC